MRLILMAAAIAAGSLADAASAQELAGTLQKIKAAGTIAIGHRESSIPFSYYGKNEKVVGYTIDLCYRIADAVKAKLGLDRLGVKLVPLTAANRIPLMLNGTTDLECGSTSNNLEREKVVAFAVTHFVAANRFVAKAAANLKTLDDLKGKTVVSTVGTTNLKQISDLNAQRGLGLAITAANDHGEAFRMLETDRAAAFVMDDILLYGLVANSPAPADYAVSLDALSVEPYGIMLRREDAAFKRIVDDTLIEIYRSGDIYPIYHKWFLEPIPPNGVNLNIPMSASLRRSIEMPTDSGDPQTYLAAEQSH
ncbi:MAG TPA: amino acid ABC transporter substrate-binding protein [Xanthobacteraceae bacterium]|nr:amino acid ABC transporter substrate-binding protein [Xanthobacteraceae bacterium]